MADNILYWGSGSGPCWRVMLALEEKGFPMSTFPNQLISFGKKEHKTLKPLLELNPRGQVPTLRFKGHIINESMAACEFIEATNVNQGTRLIPEDPVELAQVRQRMFETGTLQTKSADKIIYVYMFAGTADQIDQEKMKKSKEELKEELAIWNGYLEKNGEGSFIAGKCFSMADIYFIPLIAWMVRCGIQLSPTFPSLADYYQRMTERPSVKNTWPPHWNEGPAKNLFMSDIL